MCYNWSQSEKICITNVKNRKKIAKKFNIKLTDDRNLFDAREEGVSDKIVKLLCQKGMVDPFDDSPMEVSGTRKWI